VTVRRRLFGPFAVFIAAVAVISSARGQQPVQPFPVEVHPHNRNLNPDEVKNRIEWFLNRNQPGAKMPPAAGPNIEEMAELLKLFGQNPGANQKLDPKELERLKNQLGPKELERLKNHLDANPELRKQLEGMRPKGGPAPEFGKENRPPFDPRFKNEDRPPPPMGLKIDPPVKRPGPAGGEPPQPPPPVDRKGGPVNPTGPEQIGPPIGREMRPWEQPERPQDKAREAAAAMWERSIGPLDETPAVKSALFDIVEGTGDLKDPDGNSFWETLSKEFGDGKSLGNLLDGVDAGDGLKMSWEFPKFDWNFNWGTTRTPSLDPGTGGGSSRESWWSRWRRSPSSSSSGSSWFSGWRAPKWNIGIPALDGTWLPVVFLVAALIGGVLLWRWLARRGGADAARIDPYALGPWPVDPHRLASRQDVVVAFEHLSVLICGPVAKTWTHTTIAGSLAELAMAEPGRAMMLARLYELARYTPVEEPLTTAELAEARRLVCRLAGFGDD
jgi:hypothetical protein